jgi:hypothetical protein
MGVFEGYTQMNYGDPDHMSRFELVKSIFPENFTMKDIVSSFFKIIKTLVAILTQPFPVVFPNYNFHLGLYIGQCGHNEGRGEDPYE